MDISDTNDPTAAYTSQLVQLTQSQYQYTASAQAHDTGFMPYKLLKIVNSNTAPVTLNISAALAKEVSTSMNIGLIAGDTYRIHDASGHDTRIVQISLPAGSTTMVNVQYELLQPIAFPFQISFAINY